MNFLTDFSIAKDSANKVYNTLFQNQVEHFSISHGKVHIWFKHYHEPDFCEVFLKDIFNDKLFELLWNTSPYALSEFVEELFAQINIYLEKEE